MNMKATALTPILYKNLFGTDVLQDLGDSPTLDTIQQLAFVMRMQAQGPIENLAQLKYSDFLVWVNLFPYGYFMDPENIKDILQTWSANLKTDIDPKNADGARLDH